jgi:YVTN family beta-propeller protein
LLFLTVPAKAEPFVYVANSGSDSVSVIDTSTNTVVAAISVGTYPFGVAITPDGAFAYVTNLLTHEVSVIRTSDNTVVATIPVGDRPWDIAITPDGDLAYVTHQLQTPENVSVIDTSTNTVVATLTLGLGFARGVAFTPDSALAYVGIALPYEVWVINTSTSTVAAVVSGLGSQSSAVAITPDGAKAYVTKVSSAIVDTVSVIDTSTNTIEATVPVGSVPHGVAITPDGAFVYVINLNSQTVSVIDTLTNTVVDTFDAWTEGGRSPWKVAITPDGAFAYVTNLNSANVSVIDTSTNTIVATVNVGSQPHGVAITPVAGGTDSDSDGVPDDLDNAPNNPNPDQRDVDGDGVGDVADPCPSDPTDSCDQSGSAAESIGADGGIVATDNGNVTITIPAGALLDDTSISVTDMGENFVLESSVGQAVAIFGVEIQPEGTVFNLPITLVFAWDDEDDDGTVDETNIPENKLVITKDAVAITGQCQFDAGCDQSTNTFTFLVTSLSEFTLAGPLDTDNDGVADDFDGIVDVCVDTEIPEETVPTVTLKKNRYALKDNSPVFEGSNKTVFTTTDTGGCSCEQIIEALNLGEGHVMFGCSKSAMDEWVEYVNP